MENGGEVAFEWPRFNRLWKLKEVKNMMRDLKLQLAHFDGCALGLRLKSGVPIKKPWTIATTSKHIADELVRHRCPGKHAHPYHETVTGAELESTGYYNIHLAAALHRGWRRAAGGRIRTGPRPPVEAGGGPPA